MIKKEKIITWCERTIDWLFLVIIFLTPIYFAYFAENFSVFELNKLLIVRSGTALILSLFLIKTCLGAKVFYYNKKVWWLSLAILSVYVLGGVVFSLRPNLSLWGNYYRQQGVYSLVFYWLFFILLLLNLKSWQQIKRIIIVVLTASALVSFYGIAQHFGFDPQKWSESSRKCFSSLGQPNFLGHYLVMVIPLTIGAWRLAKPKEKYFLPILLLVQIACLLFTFSRSAWLALIFCSIFFLFLFLVINKKRKLVIFFSLSFFFLFFLIFFLGKQSFCSNSAFCPFYNRFVSSFNFSFDTNKLRLEYWSTVPSQFAQAPWWQSFS
jgi:O-antigen ligase